MTEFTGLVKVRREDIENCINNHEVILKEANIKFKEVAGKAKRIKVKYFLWFETTLYEQFLNSWYLDDNLNKWDSSYTEEHVYARSGWTKNIISQLKDLISVNSEDVYLTSSQAKVVGKYNDR